MKKIISINKKRFSNNFYYVNYEDDSFDVLYIDILNKYCLSKGSQINDDEYPKIREEIDYFYYKDKALNYLSRGSKTEVEISRKLKKLNASQSIIYKVINNLKEYNYVDDLQTAQKFMEFYLNAGKSKTYTIGKLKAKGISKEIVSSVFENFDTELELNSILKQIQKKERKLQIYDSERQKKQYLFQHLSLKGFNFQQISKAVDFFLSNKLGDEEVG